MNSEWLAFCQTLELEHWDNAQKTWSEMASEGHQQPILKANTRELFQKSFSFADIGHNDDVIQILSDLEVAQGNLNGNPDNEGLLQKYIQTAKIASKNLEKEYSQYWTNPGEKIILAEREKAEQASQKKKTEAEEEFENVFLGYFH